MECRMSIEKTEAAIEAILFTMGESVEAEKIAVAIEHDVDTTVRITVSYTHLTLPTTNFV